MVTDGFPDGLEIKNIFLSRRHGFDSWAWKIPWRKKLQPTPVFLLGKFHGAWWATFDGVTKESHIT